MRAIVGISIDIQTIYVTLGAIFGAAIGSFVAAYGTRVGTPKSPIHTRSSCETCGHLIRPLELIPIVSWVVLGGKCAACKAPLFKRYVLVEAGFALLGALYGAQSNFAITDIAILTSIALLSVCIISDSERMLLPMPPMIIVFVLGLVFSVSHPSLHLLDQLISSGVGVALLGIPASLYFLVRKTHGFGEGDYYLMAAIGIWSTPAQICEVFYLGIVSCLLTAVSLGFLRRKQVAGSDAYPLGAFLAAIGLLPLIQLLFAESLWFQRPLMQWLMSQV